MTAALNGKRVLITGGAIRVGAVIAKAFANAGAQVVIHCCRHAEEASQLPAEKILCCDLTEPGAPEKLIADAGPLDILVNNASAYVRTPFLDESEEDVRKMLDINFLAPLSLMKAFARAYSGRDGIIINLLDQAVSGHAPDAFGYLVSKKALADATESAALALAPRIRSGTSENGKHSETGPPSAIRSAGRYCADCPLPCNLHFHYRRHPLCRWRTTSF